MKTASEVRDERGGSRAVKSSTAETPPTVVHFVGNDRLLFGMILGVLCFWLAQTTLNIGQTMAAV